MPNVATPIRDLLAVIEGYAGALESPPDQGAEAIRCSRSNALFCDTSSTDAPICQDTRSGSQVCGLARSVVCHHALKDLAGEKAFETADDLPFGPPFSGASFDVVEGW